MTNYKIKLIWRPDFYENNSHILNNDFNELFWEYIFNIDKISKFIDLKDMSLDVNEFKYVVSNLKISLEIIKSIRYKSIWVKHLLFSFNIINTYLIIIERFLWGIVLRLYDWCLSDDVYSKMEETIFFKFYKQECKKIFEKLNDGDILNISITYSEEMFQLNIINNILEKEYNKKIKFNIFLWWLVIFENKRSFKNKLLKKIKNIENVSYDNFWESSSLIFWDKYKNYLLYSRTCSWRKCVFCNIWKFGNDSDVDILSVVNKIEKEKVKYINISDPSLTVDKLLDFCNLIIDRWIKIKIHIMLRFSEEFTLEVCRILWKAWISFMWVWLESASTRLNNLMWKYDKNYWVNDFSVLIENCEKSWIKLHYYTIFWFPTETKEEILLTKNFLMDNVKKYSFFTYTFWYFKLSKWTYVYNNPSEYDVSFKESNYWAETFIENYHDDNFERNRKELEDSRRTLIKSIFFWDVENNISYIHFWAFIQHSFIFHIQKMYYLENPYIKFFNINKSLLPENFLDKIYIKNNYLQFYKKNKELYVKNWVLVIEEKINSDIVILLKNFNYKVSLIENCNRIDWFNVKENSEKLYTLVKKYFLIWKI